MIPMALFFGTFVLSTIDNSDPQKFRGLAAHMSIGLFLGALLVVRLIIRIRSETPPHATTGNALLDRIGPATHWVMYLLVALMILSGLGTALGAGLFPIVFGGSGEPLPADFSDLMPRAVHGWVGSVIMIFVALHIAAALYHQIILRDGLFGRMWFGKRR